MDFDLSDEQKLLAEQARRLLAERSPPSRLRALIDSGQEWDAPLWRELAELGFPGVTIPQPHGGLGLGALDLGVIGLELGRANCALPFFSSIVLAAQAITLAGSPRQQAEYLPKLASGETIATLAYNEEPGGWSFDSIGTVLGDGRLSGRKTPVADGGVAGLAIVLAKGAEQPVFAVVDLDQPGVKRVKLAGFDQLRAHYALEFEGAAAEVLTGAPASDVLARLFDEAAVQLAFEAVGGAEACLHMARDYALERHIFGRSLASYQAIKHKLADVLTALEMARSSAYYAGWAIDNAPKELPMAAAAARLMAISAFEQVVRETMQVHGGIGYTFEANCHFYYRRERTLALSLGGRERWADRLLGHHPDLRGSVGWHKGA